MANLIHTDSEGGCLQDVHAQTLSACMRLCKHTALHGRVANKTPRVQSVDLGVAVSFAGTARRRSVTQTGLNFVGQLIQNRQDLSR